MTRQNQDFCGFNKLYKLHKACSDDHLRPAMQYIAFVNGYAYATDAYIAVRASLKSVTNLSDEEIELLNGYAVHKTQFADLLKYSIIRVTDGAIEVENEKWGSFTLFKLTKLAKDEKDVKKGAIRYPNVEALFAEEAGSAKLLKVCFNHKLLGRVLSAMGLQNKNVGLQFTEASGKMFILGVEEGIDVRGIIMPCIVD